MFLDGDNKDVLISLNKQELVIVIRALRDLCKRFPQGQNLSELYGEILKAPFLDK